MARHLLKAPIGSLFLHYLLPSVGATLVTAIYLFADTVMVGHRLGADALAALNLIIPLEFGFFAVGALLGNGGAVCITRRLHRGDALGARRHFATAALIAGGFAVIVTPLTLFALRPLLAHVLGAQGVLLEAALAYGRFIAAGCPLFVAATFLPPLLRHDHAPRRAMVGVLAGGLANIALDWLFIYPLGLGLAGAGLATALGAALTVVIMFTHFCAPTRALRWGRPALCLLPRIVHYGGGAFLQELSGCATVLLLNRLTLQALGAPGLVLYGVLANHLLIMAALFNGIAQAAQPLVAANTAARQIPRVRHVLRLALPLAGGLGLLVAIAAVLAPRLFLQAFLPQSAIVALPEAAPTALITGLLCLPLMGIGQVASLQLPALGHPTAGAFFAFLRNGPLLIALGLLLNALLGPWRLWLAFPLAEGLLLCPALLRLHRAVAPNASRRDRPRDTA